MAGIIPFGEVAEVGSRTSEPQGWKQHFNAGVVTAAELQSMQLKRHAPLLADWFCEADLGFLFAQRGVGKTHLGLGIARALAEGTSIGPWHAHAPVPVLYVDGEMNAEQIRDRDRSLAKSEEAQLFYLNHEILFERTEKSLNLALPECQNELMAMCVVKGVRVLVLDNLSTLFSGVEENKNDAWEAVLPWLLRLRRQNIAVVIVHHAGRNGQMRGASRREDAAAWVIRLDSALDVATEKRGARFVSTFTKPSRHTAREVPPFEWEFSPDPVTGKGTVTVHKATGLEVFIQWIRDGLDSCSDIAKEMGISNGQVSKLASKAEAAGLIQIQRRKYILTDGNEEQE